MPRLPPVPRRDADPRAIKIYDRMFGADRDPVASPGTATGSPGNFFTVWANAPAIMDHMLAVTPNAERGAAAIDQKLHYLAACRTGYAIQSKLVFSQNCKTCRAAGVPEDKIAAIPSGTVSNLFSEEERAVLAYVDANVLERGRARDEVLAVLRKTLSDEQVIALSFTINLFAMHARSCRALRLEFDDVPDRITEIPKPETPGVQDWR